MPLISYPSPQEAVNPEDGSIDVHVELEDGRVYSFLVATPNNIYWCMDNEGIDHFFGTPPVFVRRLNRGLIEQALSALVSEDGGKWLSTYGTLQR